MDNKKLYKQKLDKLIRPFPDKIAGHHVFFSDIESWLERQSNTMPVVLIPDFQRGHVWNETQQTRYIESVLRGAVKDPVIMFNNPFWFDSIERLYKDGVIPDGYLQDELVCIDGLQRLTAIRKFMAGEIKPFGLNIESLYDTPYSPRRSLYAIRVEIYQFKTRKALLQFYLDLNSGGTPHSTEELERVEALKLNCVDSDKEE